MLVNKDDNQKLIRQFYEALNRHDLNVTAGVAAREVSWTDVPSGMTYRGPDGFKQSNQVWLTAFPDANIRITNLASSENFVVVEYVGTGTQQGPFRTPDGEFSPTGRKMQLKCCDVIEIRNGKIQSGRSYYDLASLMKQLGLAAPDAKAA